MVAAVAADDDDNDDDGIAVGMSPRVEFMLPVLGDGSGGIRSATLENESEANSAAVGEWPSCCC